MSRTAPLWSSAGAAEAAIALGPPMLLCAMALHAPGLSVAEAAARPWWLVLGLACAVTATAGGLAARRWPRVGGALASLAVVGFVLLVAPRLVGRPAFGLALLLPAVALLLGFPMGAREERGPAPARDRGTPEGGGEVVGWASVMALISWILVVGVRAAEGSLALGLAAASLLLAIGDGACRLASLRRLGRWRRVFAVVVLAASVALALVARAHPFFALTCLVPAPVTLLLVFRSAARGERLAGESATGLWSAIAERPARLLAFTFAVLILLGAFVLALPASSATGAGLPLVDAAFTAVSAACVTGLTVVDTLVAFSATGHVAILVLVQLGGLGIMTFYTAGLVVLGRRLALRQEAVVAGLLDRDERHHLGRALAQVLAVTFVFESLGAAALALLFRVGGEPSATAAWHGVFTAVSAFCNAGFALSSDNLVAYQRSPLVLHVVAGLIIAGGLGPAVIAALPALVRRRRAPLQAKVVVTVTAALLVGGAVLYAALEWRRSLAGLGLLDRLHNAWFQSVTTRTAGFNSVDLSTLGPATVTVVIVLMFIGGSPGSTAGGIKTTTAALLAAAVGAALRGRPEVELFGRRVPHLAVYKAAAILALYAGAAVVAVIVLELTQPLAPHEALFEVVSALGTVGLTIGGTPKLDGVGKIVVMVCMFLGRVGPLTLFMLLAGHPAARHITLPEESVSTG